MILEGVESSMESESHSIAFYEEQFKSYVMYITFSGKSNSLKSYLCQLICQNETDYKLINYAYLKVKRELIGQNL